jgi:hypothetical protein
MCGCMGAGLRKMTWKRNEVIIQSNVMEGTDEESRYNYTKLQSLM